MSEQRHNVLVIDDSHVARASIVSVLKAGGFRTYERDTPIGATVDIVRHEIDAVVLDMQMPVMTGERFAEVLRKNGRLDSVVLVMVTGAEEQRLDEVGRRVGADLVLSKRQIPHDLVPALRRTLKGGRGRWQPPPNGSAMES